MNKAMGNLKKHFLPSLLALVTTLCMLTASTPTFAQSLLGKAVDYANPRSYRIAGLTVVGAEYSDVQAIKLFSGLQEGQEITIPGDKISDAIRKLWKQRLFADIDISIAEVRGNDIFMVISLKEMPRLSRFSLEGIKKSEADNIREKLNIRTGVVCNENLKRTSENIIKSFYTEKGFYSATVQVKELPDDAMQNGSRLIFEISRGPRVKVEAIQFEGVKSIAEKKLKRVMKETKEQRWWRVFKSSKFLDDKYLEDKEKIVALYNKEGFRNAKIAFDTVQVLNPERLKILIKVEEDRKFYFRNVTFIGNTKYRTATLDSILNIRKGDIYNLDLLSTRLNFNQQGRDVASLYTDDGYLNFYAFPVETLVPEDSIDIEVRMMEGKQFRIGKVSVSGNTKTNDHVIYREIRTRPGDLFNRSDVIRTQRELAALNYFDPEKFDIKTLPNDQNGTVDLEYVVEEKPSDQIQLSGGWGGGRVVGSLGLTFNNFSMRKLFDGKAYTPIPSGDGQRISIQATSNGTFFQSYNISFTEPWLGGKKPNSLSISGYRSVQTNGQAKKLNGETNPFRQSLVITGASASFGKRLQKPDDWFVMYAGLSYQKFELNNYQQFFSFSNGFSNNLAASFTLERNSVSDPIYPTWGSKITFTGKGTLPYTFMGEKFFGKTYDYPNFTDQQKFDWVEYYKFKFTANWYTALNKHKERKFVLHTNVGFGFLGAYNSKLGDAPFERFYLGGVYLSGFLLDGREIVNLRGYPDLSLTPTNSSGRQIGAPLISKYSLELRYPLSTNPSATIFAQAFTEAGKTWTDFTDYNPFNMYRSAGVGLRIFLPMFGLLGFDYGWRLDNLPNTTTSGQRGQFHFSIGMNLGEL
jgi:outer membrane protein insertion porin family